MTQHTFNFEDFGFAKIGNIRDVRYAHPANTAEYGLVCTIDLQLSGGPLEEGVTYVCHPDDNVETGRFVWETCSKVDPRFIAPYLPAPAPSTTQLSESARSVRNGLLSEIDSIATNPMRWGDLSSDQQNQVAQYRNALKNVPQQSGFPHSVEWPIVPTCIAGVCSVVQADDRGLFFSTRPQ
jgi:hypothetical protein